MSIQVAIIMGSKSDWDVMSHAAAMLSELDIQNEAKVISAHRKKAQLDQYCAKLQEKEGITVKRVWIDEYGYNTACGSEFSAFEQMLYSKYVCQAGLEWEAHFVMYWEFYNNEVVNGVQCGYWMIDDENQKQPVYHLYHDFFDWAQIYVTEYEQANGSQPSRSEFGQAGSDFLSQYELAIGEANQAIIPDDIILHPSYPNPFNPSNLISFQLDGPKLIILGIYDVLGREIIRLVDDCLLYTSDAADE